MLVLVMSTSYLTAKQSQKLLQTFCPAVSEQETNRAGTLLHMAAVDPLDYWRDLLPLLEKSVQSDMHELARTVGVLDLGNPTNRHATHNLYYRVSSPIEQVEVQSHHVCPTAGY